MGTVNFIPDRNITPSVGMVLRLTNPELRFLRVTHCYRNNTYVMWVKDAEFARYARRPVLMTLQELEKLAINDDAQWGRIILPPSLINEPCDETGRKKLLDAAWEIVNPLIEALDNEDNLSRRRFTSIIRERAAATHTPFITLHRMIIRYYYFGRTRFGLLPLPRGARPGQNRYKNDVGDFEKNKIPKEKRRGRQSVLAKELGNNDFIVTNDDILDMITCLKRRLCKGPTFITDAHEDYLAQLFRLRHPSIYKEYLEGKRLEPVTLRQYRYYTDNYAKLSEDLAKNLCKRNRNPGYLGSVFAVGPGEVYEIDSTGGRVYLVNTENPPVIIGKPTIYLIIDRWSRYVVSVYISLSAPSYEEVRHALLIAFTSRITRFKMLGVDIDDERWPVGKMPAVICPDRGSDFLSQSMEQAVVQNMRIELTPLPPYCPDGKAIVERFIREMKRRLASSSMKGVYAERPLNPNSKKAARKAEFAAVHSLSEAYRKLIEIIDDHNNRPHRTLKRRRTLLQAGIEPTPKNAYVWGLENITGLRSAPFSDDDYWKMLLSFVKASMSKGIIQYRGRPYCPKNEAAYELAAKSSNRAKQIDIHVDITCPNEVYVVNRQGEWSIFEITQGAARDLMGTTLEEEMALSQDAIRLWARADHDSRIKRVVLKSSKTKLLSPKRVPAITVDQQQKLQKRAEETTVIKQGLYGKMPSSSKTNKSSIVSPESSWIEIHEQERLAKLDFIRRQRKRR